MVANRDAVVSATIDAAIPGPMDLPVSVDVVTVPADSSDPTAPPGRPVLAASTSVHLRPGLNKVILPTTGSFRLSPGEFVQASVTVTDPPNASPADDVDNTLSTDGSITKEAIETRPLAIEFMSPTTSAGRVACSDLASIASRQIAFARAAMPLDSTGVRSYLSCGELYPLQADEPSILRYLTLLDWLARHSEVDVMVGVVPSGWLSTAAGGAVGIAAPGLRAALIEQSSPSMTLAHEVAHTFGIGHVTGDGRVTGVRLDQRRSLDGTDWMSERTPEKAWTGATTWDDLAVRFGPPGGIPAAPVPLSPDLQITGTLTNAGENLPGEWTPGNTAGAAVRPRRPGTRTHARAAGGRRRQRHVHNRGAVAAGGRPLRSRRADPAADRVRLSDPDHTGRRRRRCPPGPQRHRGGRTVRRCGPRRDGAVARGGHERSPRRSDQRLVDRFTGECRCHGDRADLAGQRGDVETAGDRDHRHRGGRRSVCRPGRR